MPATFTTEEKVPYSVSYTTATGNPAPVDGAPVATTSDSAVVTAAPAADGMSGFFVSGDTPGTATVTVTADADLDATGFQAIPLSDTITITAPGATGGTLSFGAPEPK